MNKEYRQAHYQEYKKSKDGLIAHMYCSQLSSSRNRNHPKPEYNLKELRVFVHSLENFDFLFNQWKENNFSREYAPSLDRIDPTLPYQLNNLNLCTWSDNRKKRFNDQLFVLKSDNTSNVTGVSYHNYSNKWVAQMIVNGKHIWLGHFDNKESAIIARIRGDLDYGYLLKENFDFYINSLVDSNELGKKYSITEVYLNKFNRYTKYTGVRKDKNQWVASIKQNQVVTTLGRFSNPRDAYIKRIETEYSLCLLNIFEYEYKLSNLDNFLNIIQPNEE